MKRFALAAAVTGLVCLSTLSAQAGGRRHVQYHSACGGTLVTSSAPVAEPGPPTAPTQGQTVQNLSVEPQAAPALQFPTNSSTVTYGSSSNETFRYLQSYHSHNHRYTRVGDAQNRRQHPEGHFASMR